MDVNVLNDRLMNGEVTVTFTKADGTERVMRCTKDFDLVPVDQHPAQHDPVDYVDLMKVFDLDVQGWRSFKPSRVISYE